SELGSNGLAFGSQATRRGDGLLLANPHFPWRGVDRFWMAHLTVPGYYDVLGGTLGGFPLVGVGFNKHLAWTHTVSTGRRFVIVQLKLAPGDPTSYVVDGKTIPMTRTTVRVAGTPHTFYGTRYGLAVTIPEAGYRWTADTAYALLDTNLDNSGIVDQYIEMGRAKSVRELLEVEERGRGIPFFNTVAADRTGTALYADVGRYSNVPKSLIDTCTPAGAPQIVYAAARVITLDGSRSACEPQGLLPASEQPRLLRRDYVLNSNDSFWLSNPKAPITGITPLIGLSDVIQGVRTRYGHLAVQAALARGHRFTIRSLQAFWQSDRNHLAELVSKQLAQLCRDNPSVTLADGTSVDIGAACPVLEAYDQTGNLDSKGAWLFAAYTRRSPSGADYWADPVDLSNPLTTPNRLNTANPQHLRALGEAVRELRAHGIPLDSGMRGVQVATRGSRKSSIHGCANCFQNINSSNGEPAVNAPYGEVIQGSSMVLTTRLTRRGPRGEGILTYSQATDPTSRWHANMTRKFSRKRWVPMRFSARELASDPGRRTVRLPHVRPSSRP
ncbi:MAG TPA: penicillin acylase family protein, partial [Thermoleophilaceae bacterium]|nr:penicillin acylase family protein [Thermoleophilaceae bacterium]